MKVKIKGKTTVFDVKIVSKLDYEEFKKLCNDQSTFKQLPEKKRIAKIKEVYGNLKTNATESGKTRKEGVRSNISSGDAKSDGRDSGAEQTANVGRKDIKGKEDKAEIRKQGLSKKDSE